MSHFITCPGSNGKPHKIYKANPLFDGLCLHCAIDSIRQMTGDPTRESVPVALVRALLHAYDQSLHDHRNEVNFIQRQAAEDIEEAADRGRWEGERNAERGSWW